MADINEKDRIAQVYNDYENSNEWKERYSYFNSDVLMTTHEIERAIIKFLKAAGINRENVKEKKLIEIGAGGGQNLQRFMAYGFLPENITYNEIIDRNLEQVKDKLPQAIDYILEDARNIDEKYNGKFDVVLVSTVFSSILDEVVRKELATKICDLLKKNGIILFYDFIYDNPQNKNVAKVTASQIKTYFGEGNYYKKKLHLAPPIARKLAKKIGGTGWYYWFNVPVLRTHLLTMIVK